MARVVRGDDAKKEGCSDEGEKDKKEKTDTTQHVERLSGELQPQQKGN